MKCLEESNSKASPEGLFSVVPVPARMALFTRALIRLSAMKWQLPNAVRVQSRPVLTAAPLPSSSLIVF